MSFVFCDADFLSARCRATANACPRMTRASIRSSGLGRSAAACAALLIGIFSVVVPVLASPRTVSDGRGAQRAALVQPITAQDYHVMMAAWFGPLLSSAELAASAGGFSDITAGAPFVLAAAAHDDLSGMTSGQAAPLGVSGESGVGGLRYLCPDRRYTSGPSWNNHTYGRCGGAPKVATGGTLPFITVRAGLLTPPAMPDPPPIPLPCGGTLTSISSTTVLSTPGAGVFGVAIH